MSVQQEHFSIYSKHRLLIPEGKVVLGCDDDKPILLEVGKRYNIDNSYFSYTKRVDLTLNQISHGSLYIVIVKDIKLDISYDDDKIKILKPDRQFLTKVTHYFQGVPE